jgi:hypothetical protein
VDGKWSLAERKGFLRLHSLPAENLWTARNTLTQRAVGPLSEPTVVLEAAGMKPGDVAGLALFNRPYQWLGVERNPDVMAIAQFNEQTGETVREPLTASRVWLRARSDFRTNLTQFSFSTDGKIFRNIGAEVKMTYSLTTFQGVRDSLFSYNRNGEEGGFADFDSFTMNESEPHGLTKHGLTKPIPVGKRILLYAGEPALLVVDRKLGRVALRSPEGFLSVGADGAVSHSKTAGDAETFQWIETFTGELTLMSLTNHRYLRVDSQTGKLIADSPGPLPDGKDGVRFNWRESQ